ncbi:MAG: hypothetical protein ACQERJ_05605 [Bacillota bacterium]
MRVNSKKLVVLSMLLCAIVFSSAIVLAAGVKPLVIDVRARPGDQKEFELTLTPSGKEEQVKFDFYKPVQLLTGGLKYQKETEHFAAKDWISLAENEVTLYPDRKKTIKGSIKIPFEASGSHTVVIMVEPQQKVRRKNGLRVKVRYAVRVNIRVQRAGVYPQADIVEFDLAADKKNKPQVRAMLENPSQLDYLVAAEATVRDQKRRLVERITLKSPEGNSPELNQTRMYPQSKVAYVGAVTKRLTPGQYKVRVFFKYADHGQIIKAKDVAIKAGQFDFPSPDELAALNVQPQKIMLNLNSPAYKSQIIRLTSQLAETAEIKISTREVKENYEHSVVDWISIRGKKEFKLPARKRGQVITTTVVPRDLKSGSYHGSIVLEAFQANTGKAISEQVIPITVVVGEEHDYQVELEKFYLSQDDKGYLLNLDLFNQSAIFIKSKAEVIIKDKQGQFVERLNLTFRGDKKEILPQSSGLLQGRAKKLKAGDYQAEIKIIHNNQELKTAVKKFEVVN